MKKPGPELGELSSRFFAYIQLKQKDTIRTGELASVLGIPASKERSLLHRLSNSGWIVRLKRGVYLTPPRIPAGGKYSPGVALILHKLMEEGTTLRKLKNEHLHLAYWETPYYKKAIRKFTNEIDPQEKGKCETNDNAQVWISRNRQGL